MNNKESLNILKKINLAYPIFNLTKERINFWIETIANLDYKKTDKILNDFIKVNKFPPTIADLSKINTNKGNYKQREYSEEFLEGFYANTDK